MQLGRAAASTGDMSGAPGQFRRGHSDSDRLRRRWRASTRPADGVVGLLCLSVLAQATGIRLILISCGGVLAVLAMRCSKLCTWRAASLRRAAQVFPKGAASQLATPRHRLMPAACPRNPSASQCQCQCQCSAATPSPRSSAPPSSVSFSIGKSGDTHWPGSSSSYRIVVMSVAPSAASFPVPAGEPTGHPKCRDQMTW